ncbi:MAG: class I tRNA ligase family protein, partial [Patescibacteria group bacterium]
ATGLPHYGHILASTIKDLIPRFQTMRGYRVDRRWGWDCHGLPIETIVEKELKLAGKKEIEAKGVDVFNESARSKVLTYVSDWKKTVDRIGRWVDFDGSYKTMDNSYMESVWWALKTINDKGLLYEGNKVLMYCPRCETPVSKAEVAMDSSYKTITEEAITVKFKIKNPKEHNFPEKTFILAWTTTPWTLPANMAVAVGSLIQYVLVKKGEEYFVVAGERSEAVFKVDFEVVRKFDGSEIVGIEYEPLFENSLVQKTAKKSWFVTEGDFVTTTDGTGIVHIANMYGEDDYQLGLRYDLPQIPMVSAGGMYNENAPNFLQGIYYKKGEKLVKDDLVSRELLFSRENYTHEFPHCWRCETALIYKAVEAWFIAIEKIKQRLLELNQKMHWIPDHLKDGRYKNILENAPDWNISRNRFWATPLPFWRCSDCKKVEVLGGVDELKLHSKKSGNRYFVMRHGEADSNVAGVMSSLYDAPSHLTEKGRREVEYGLKNLADKKIDLIFSSDFIRTKETANLIAKGLSISPEAIIFDERLREVDSGDLHGKPISEYRDSFSSFEERFTKCPSGSKENLNQVKARISSFLYELESKFKGKNILIISHESPLWLLSAGAVFADISSAIKMKEGVDEFIKTGESRELSFVPLPHNAKFELDLHRPYIDEIELVCSCGGSMIRTPEVIDCWFESASMPFASAHYPFENGEWFKKHFPAQFVAEYIAQTRTWFYYSAAVSALLFDNIPFENIVTTGTILAEDGEKMSKSKGNFPDPWILFNKYGVDALRLYLMSSPLMHSEDLNFSERGVKEMANKVVMRMENSLSFYELNKNSSDAGNPTLSAWIKSRLAEMVRDVTASLERYEIDLAVRPIEQFVEDFSVWYIRRSRKNFDVQTTREVLKIFAKTVAPIAPFLADHIWQAVKSDEDPETVHLSSWPESIPFDLGLLSRMAYTREVVSSGMLMRQKIALPVRQPLSSVSIKASENVLGGDRLFLELIADELNVKEVILNEKQEEALVLDTNVTEELRSEGLARELLRALQGARKEAGLLFKESATAIISKEYEILPENLLKKTFDEASIVGHEFSGDIVHVIRSI